MCDNPFNDMIDEYEESLQKIRDIIAQKKDNLRKTYALSQKAYFLKADIVAYRAIEKDLSITIDMLKNYYQKRGKKYVKKKTFTKD